MKRKNKTIARNLKEMTLIFGLILVISFISTLMYYFLFSFIDDDYEVFRVLFYICYLILLAILGAYIGLALGEGKYDM